MSYPTTTHTGARWQRGLPPGVYEDQPRRTAPRDVRMDVAAFIGLTERGPVAVPVALQSWDEFRYHFGEAGGGRLLPQSVALFFANGGRRCVVVRALDYGHARAAEWVLPGLGIAAPGGGLPPAAGAEVRLIARNPGAWGNTLRLTVSFEQRPLALFLPGDALTTNAPPGQQLGARWLVVQNGERLAEGTLVRFVRRKNADETEELFRFVRELRPLLNGRQAVAFHEPIPADFRQPVPPPPAPADASSPALTVSPFAPAHDGQLGGRLEGSSEEVSVRLEMSAGEIREIWPDMALHPAHPRFLVRRLSRRAASELYMDERTSAATPVAPAGSTLVDEGDVALLEQDNRRDELFLHVDNRRAGSTLARFPRAVWNDALLPARGPEGGARSVLFDQTRQFAGLSDLMVVGGDATQQTKRLHFFSAPGESLAPGNHDDLEFADQPSPLEAIGAYDEHNECEPVSLVCMPDLAHPRQLDPFAELPDVPPEQELTFTCCLSEGGFELPEAEAAYPWLSLNRLDEVHRFQRALVEYCEIKADRIAVLDLPPGLSHGEIVQWRRRLSSRRAALYTPYLRCRPVEAPDEPLITMPPSGAVCGIVARREHVRGVHVAPANETLRDVATLLDEQSPPEPGFLHEERINAVRPTERGLDLLGSRTTSFDRLWTHVSVRRLVDYIERQLAIDTRWAVFEPNNHVLWTRLRQTAERRLAPLYRAGAFSGPTEDDSYFVRCDAETNSRNAIDSGRVVVLVGVAPSQPAEFIVFRLTRLSDGGATLEEINA